MEIIFVVIGIIVFVIIASTLITLSFFKKVSQGKALVRTGMGPTKVAFEGMMIIPILHKGEVMDISVKKVEIHRVGKDGLICKDNMRADIKVAFFVRVNPETAEVKKVAQSIGCERASDITTLNELFEAKFSEALKTVGKKFDFVQLYDSRKEFKQEILDIIGTDLNGYLLDDAAIDYLEQTPISFLRADNILDSEGIKKITELTAEQNMKSNLIRREEEKVIRKQDVEAREAILELDRQLAEKEEKQKREIANIQARENASAEKVAQEERLKSESARIASDEEIEIAEANKERQVIVAQKNKERTEAIETERVEKDRMLEVTERERIVTLAEIEKEKVLEVERKNIQDVIRERVIVEKEVVTEEEKIKDTRAFAEADRLKKVAITGAEQEAEKELILHVQKAEAVKEAAKFQAEQAIIEADARKNASVKEAEARKIIAEAKADEEAALGKSEAQVIEAKAQAHEIEGIAEAKVIEATAKAEAESIRMRANANKEKGLIDAEITQEQGMAEAKVIEEQARAEASGIEQKAEAMKKLDGVGREHEEFKLRLDKQKEVELAEINIQESIAQAQASTIAEALRNSNIDIVGGETMFFEKIVKQITTAKGIDRLVNESETLSDVKNMLLNSNENGENLMSRISQLVRASGMDSDTLKNMSISLFLYNLQNNAQASDRSSIQTLIESVKQLGMGGMSSDSFKK